MKRLLPYKRQAERINPQHKLLTLQARVDASLSADDLSLARELCVHYLIEFPGDRSGYRLLGHVFERAGDPATAAQCFNARLTDTAQDQLFGMNITAFDTQLCASQRLAGHVKESCRVRAQWSDQSERLQQFERSRLCAGPTQTLMIENGRFWHDGYNTVLFNGDGEPFMDTVIGNIAPVLANISKRQPERVQGDVVLLGARGTNNYFHWMTDILPKLAVMIQSGLEWNKSTRFAFWNVSKTFQIQTLELLGIDRSQWLQTKNGHEYVSANRIIVPQLDNKMCLTMGAWVSDFLKQTFFVEGVDDAPQRKLYISRDPASAQGRDIVNAAQVNACFLSHGYEVVYPEQLSIVEQAKLFASASHVAAPHGAGLTNLHFCAPGTQVLEFHGAHFSPCYWALCEKQELDYRNLDCASMHNPAQTPLDAARTLDVRRGQGFSIPVERLSELIC